MILDRRGEGGVGGDTDGGGGWGGGCGRDRDSPSPTRTSRSGLFLSHRFLCMSSDKNIDIQLLLTRLTDSQR